ncbi:MAG TPA: glycosyltransferase [Steroidobacteraceae bacterium]
MTPASRVLHVASGDLWAGAEAQIYHVLRALHARTDTVVSAVVLNSGELAQRLRDSGITVTVIDERTTSPWQLLRGILREVKATGAQVVHTHRFKENILGSIAARLSGNALSVRTVHGRPEHSRGKTFRHAVARGLDSVTTRLQVGVVGVSSDLCEYLRAELPRSPVFFVPNGIDTAAVARIAAEPSPYARLPRWTVALVGRMVPVKRVDLFLQAAALLSHEEPGRYRFVVVGDGPLLGAMRELASTLGVAPEVDFLGFQNNSLSILKQMDCLVVSSDHEGLPMVVLEALSLGVPVVAHAVGGMPEVLAGVPGQRLVTQHTARGYATAIAELAAGALPYGPGSRECQLPADFEISNTAATYAALYRELLAKAGLQA